MIYKNIIMLLIFSLLTTMTKGQDTINTIIPDSVGINKKINDSIKVKQDCHDIKIEQRQINNEMKRQLNYLEEFINRGEVDPEKKL